jgi:hypothetical protein
MTVKDIYLEIGKTQGINAQEMEGILAKVSLRVPLNLSAEVPEDYRAEVVDMLLTMFFMYLSLSVEQRKVLISSIEKSVRERN